MHPVTEFALVAVSLSCLAFLLSALTSRRLATPPATPPATRASRDYARWSYTEHTPRGGEADTLAGTLATVGAWQSRTLGDGNRWAGLLAHIGRETVEISQTRGAEPSEWVDVWLLSVDGLRRCLIARHPHLDGDEIAALMAAEIVSKYRTNAARTWPDWRTADQSQPIEHIKGTTNVR